MVEAIVAGAVQPSSSTPAEMHVQKGNQNGPADVQLHKRFLCVGAKDCLRRQHRGFAGAFFPPLTFSFSFFDVFPLLMIIHL